MFVLMGNFRSNAGSQAAAGGAAAAPGAAGASLSSLRDDFTALGNLIDQYPGIKERSKFVFVPGPGDPGPGPVLPQPPLPSFFTKELARLVPGAIFATNPVRIRYYSQEIVAFR